MWLLQLGLAPSLCGLKDEILSFTCIWKQLHSSKQLLFGSIITHCLIPTWSEWEPPKFKWEDAFKFIMDTLYQSILMRKKNGWTKMIILKKNSQHYNPFEKSDFSGLLVSICICCCWEKVIFINQRRKNKNLDAIFCYSEWKPSRQDFWKGYISNYSTHINTMEL